MKRNSGHHPKKRITKQHKAKKKVFLSQETINEILKMSENGHDFKSIALKFNLTVRHVRDTISNNKSGIVKEFTHEEDDLLIDLYENQHIYKETQIQKYLPTKKAYMIRNRIRFFIKYNKLRPYQSETKMINKTKKQINDDSRPIKMIEESPPLNRNFNSSYEFDFEDDFLCDFFES